MAFVFQHTLLNALDYPTRLMEKDHDREIKKNRHETQEFCSEEKKKSSTERRRKDGKRKRNGKKPRQRAFLCNLLQLAMSNSAQ